jgi:toxin-antitoxin system PIN domain toxin
VVSLLDANVLIALAWPIHAHHKSARAWFKKNRRLGWATCSFTEVAFIRISSNPKVFSSSHTVADAQLALQMMRRLPHHSFLKDEVSPADSPFQSQAVQHQQITDAHLLSLAHFYGAKLVTFDRAMERLLPGKLDTSQLLEVLVA